MRLVSKAFAFVFFVTLTAFVLAPVAAVAGGLGLNVMLGGAVAVAVFCMFAPTGRRTWARGFLANGALCVAMPLTILPLLARLYEETTAAAALAAGSEGDMVAEQVGAGLGAVLIFGLTSVAGLVVGGLLLLLGIYLHRGGRGDAAALDW